MNQNGTALVKPVRVLHELTPAEQFKREIDRAIEIRNAAHERIDSAFFDRVKEAQARHMPPAQTTDESPSVDKVA